jgi:putative transposase
LPRTRRISWLNYPHLVVAQANGGAPLFVDNDDFESYLAMLRQMTRDRLLKVFAYCLLEHEIRLVVLPNRLMLSRIIQRLHGRHTARMNQKLNRVGHLFRGRFRSLVFNEADILDVVRSVHLWPVREGMLRRPEHYPYSSHGYYMGVNQDFGDFLSTSEVFGQFSGDLETKRRAFGRFVETLALESDNFGIDEVSPGIGGKNSAELLNKANMHEKSGKKSSVKTLAERVSLLLNIPLEQLSCTSRRQDLVMARRLLATSAVLGAGRTVTEVAGFLQRDKAQVSRLVAQGMDMVNTNLAFGQLIKAMRARGALAS